MHICVFSDYFPPHSAGGAGKIAGRLAQEYAESGHQVSVVTTSPSPDQSTYTYENVRVHVIESDVSSQLRAYLGIYNPKTVPEVADILDRLSPDVVHAHNVHENLSYHSLKLAKDRSIPVVLTLHDAMSFEYGKLVDFVDQVPENPDQIPKEVYQVSPIRQLLRNRTQYFPLRNVFNRKYINGTVDKRVAVSNELRRALTANKIQPVQVIRNGISVEDFTSAGTGAKFRRKYGLGNSPIILFGGRVGYMKGSQHLSQAFRVIVNECEDAVLLVTGHADTVVEDMRDIVSPHGDAIVSTGWLENSDVAAAYDAATVVATPSLYLDPLPTMNLEAMASGTAVVTSCFGGSKEMVKSGETGFVVDPRDTDQLANRLLELVTDQKKAERMGDAGRERVRRQFDLSRQAGKYIDLLRSVQ
ncbi:glycosyltransferase family 4 protein [Haloarcula sp. H-GB5]